MTRTRRILGGLLAAAVALCVAGGAGAKEKKRKRHIHLDVVTTLVSDKPGEIDPRGKRLHERIRNDYRVESLKVLDEQRVRLGVDDVKTVKLPDGKDLRVRLNDVDDDGAFLAVDLEGLKADLRARDGHMVVIGGERYQDAKQVIGIEPHYEEEE